MVEAKLRRQENGKHRLHTLGTAEPNGKHEWLAKAQASSISETVYGASKQFSTAQMGIETKWTAQRGARWIWHGEQKERMPDVLSG